MRKKPAGKSKKGSKKQKKTKTKKGKSSYFSTVLEQSRPEKTDHKAMLAAVMAAYSDPDLHGFLQAALDRIIALEQPPVEPRPA
jgi:hypothetical protein